MHLNLNISDETAPLNAVILGISTQMSGPGFVNPKPKFHLEHGSYPAQEWITTELHGFSEVLLEYGVQVFRPVNLRNQTQLFARDLGFVIGNTFFLSQMNNARKPERHGISYLLDLMDQARVVDLAKIEHVNIEGGDVVLFRDKVFVGHSSRTNKHAVNALAELMPAQKVVRVDIVTDEDDYREHSLHLDCVFQPLGKHHAIVYEDGIRDPRAFYKELDLPEENIFRVNIWQFISMFPNVFSVSPTVVIIEHEFLALKYWLEDRGFVAHGVRFREISKLGGLLRCCTLPLSRASLNGT